MKLNYATSVELRENTIKPPNWTNHTTLFFSTHLVNLTLIASSIIHSYFFPSVVPNFTKLNRYHVPRSWLQPTRNLLVIFEELGGDASKISLVKQSISSICADVSEWHPTIKNWHIDSYGKPEELHRPKVHLRCAPGQTISAIKFASFGTPSGTCGSFMQGACHATNSHTILEKVIKTLNTFHHLP